MAPDPQHEVKVADKKKAGVTSLLGIKITKSSSTVCTRSTAASSTCTPVAGRDPSHENRIQESPQRALDVVMQITQDLLSCHQGVYSTSCSRTSQHRKAQDSSQQQQRVEVEAEETGVETDENFVLRCDYEFSRN